MLASDGAAVIKLTGPHLTLETLQMAASMVAASDVGGRVLVVDFSEVYEFVGPWSIHFAILIHLARQLHRPVRLHGLHDQPLNVAWLYRGSSEVRELLGLSPVTFNMAA